MTMTMTMSRQLKSAFIALVFLTVQSSLSIGFALPQNNEEYLSFIENKTTTVPRKALMHNSNLTQYAATNAYGDETKTKLKRSLLGAAPLCRNPWCFYINTRQRLRIQQCAVPACAKRILPFSCNENYCCDSWCRSLPWDMLINAPPPKCRDCVIAFRPGCAGWCEEIPYEFLPAILGCQRCDKYIALYGRRRCFLPLIAPIFGRCSVCEWSPSIYIQSPTFRQTIINNVNININIIDITINNPPPPSLELPVEKCGSLGGCGFDVIDVPPDEAIDTELEPETAESQPGDLDEPPPEDLEQQLDPVSEGTETPEEPPLQDADPTITEEDPPLEEEDPISTEEDPALAEEEPALAEDEPAITEEEPALTEEDPALAEDEPAITEEEPALTEEEPALTEDEPAITEEEPALTEEEPALNEEEFATREDYPDATDQDVSGNDSASGDYGSGSSSSSSSGATGSDYSDTAASGDYGSGSSSSSSGATGSDYSDLAASGDYGSGSSSSSSGATGSDYSDTAASGDYGSGSSSSSSGATGSQTSPIPESVGVAPSEFGR